jgi:CHAT domain-containing protein
MVTGPVLAQPQNLRSELDAAFGKGVMLLKAGKDAEAIPWLEKAVALGTKAFGPDHLHTAALLHTTAGACQAAGRYRDAETYYGRSLAIREARLGKDHLDVAVSLHRLAVVRRHLGQYQQAEPLFRRCLEIREANLPRGHLLVTDACHSLGVILADMGRHQEAEAVLRRCARLQEAGQGKDSLDLANTLSSLAMLYRAMGRLDEAEPLARRSVQVREAKVGKDSLEVAYGMNNLALIYVDLARYDEAEPLFGRSLAIREAKLGKDDSDVAGGLNNLATLYLNTGRHGEAEPLLRRSLAIWEKRLGTEHPEVATALNNLAHLYLDVGRVSEAAPLFRRCLAIREARLGKDHPATLDALDSLAALASLQKEYADAELLLQRCLEVAERLLGKDHPKVANYLGNLAVVYRQLGRSGDAEPLYRRSLQIRKDRLGKDHPEVAATLVNLGLLCWRRGHLAEADGFLREGLAITEARLGKDHSTVADICRYLAELRQAQGRRREARQLQERCLEVYQTNLRRVFAFSSEGAMQDYVDATNGFLPATINLALPAVADDAWVAVALTWTLRVKSVTLDTLCRYRQAQGLLSPDEPLTRSVGRYRGLKQLLASAAVSPPQGLSAEQVKQQETQWHKEAEDLEAELSRGLSRAHPDQASDPETVTARAVQARLAPGAALVEFVRAPIRDFKNVRWVELRYFAFVLTPGEAPPRLIDLGEVKGIEAGLEAARRELADFQEKLRDCDSPDEAVALEKAAETRFRKVSADLYRRLIAPLRQALGSAHTLYLAPDAYLNRLPFEALVDSEGKYLVERYLCAYLSSGRDLLRPAAKPARGTVVFAGPDFKVDAAERRAMAEKLQVKNNAPAVRGLPGREVRSVGWRPLPGAAAEAKDIQKALADSTYGPVKAYVGAEALEEVLKAMPAPRILHLATHGFFLDREQDPPDAGQEGAGAGWARGRLKKLDNPLLRSGILLAGANTVGSKEAAARAEDGWVTAEEIALLDLRGTELVVLSACQTGLGEVHTGEGVYGLRRAFLYAGARALVTSLFEVPDAETRALMGRFYGGLHAGRGKLAALHEAQLQMLRQRREAHGAAHPFFWASFILVGDPS